MTSSQEDTQMNQFNPATGHKCRQATVVSAYYQGETRIQVACPPAEVYALVSDVTRMGSGVQNATVASGWVERRGRRWG